MIRSPLVSRMARLLVIATLLVGCVAPTVSPNPSASPSPAQGDAPADAASLVARHFVAVSYKQLKLPTN
jgi:PBP1b-binding outer membrane lipoprotein LpoB